MFNYLYKCRPVNAISRLAFILVIISCLTLTSGIISKKERVDTIFYNGKIIMVNNEFTICQAVAVGNGKILAVGTNNEIMKLRDNTSKIIDLKGHVVIPGLIEGHAHPVPASQSEYFEKIPDLHTMKDLLVWIKSETVNKKKGEWIIHPKFFLSRLVDMHQLTKRDLDAVAPEHPVFLNGSYGGIINTRALELSGMSNLKHQGILRDEKTGEATGMIRRSAFGTLAINNTEKLSEDQQLQALKNLLQFYNSIGITSVCSGGGSVQELNMFEKLKDKGELTVRVYQNIVFPFDKKASKRELSEKLRQLGYKTGDGDEWVKYGALKAIVDGGVLTGTAYLRQGWGNKARDVYGINDPAYRGELFYSKDELIRLITAANETGWKFTAHITGGGAVDTLLAAYEAVNHSTQLKGKRHSIIHGNFYTPEAIRKMAAMGIYADSQPAWFFKDGDLLLNVLGKDLMNTFHPNHSMLEAGIMINGGSDHMVKLDPDASINPYNPFLAMWSVVTRKTERGTVINPEEGINREQALRMYTINNAFASFEEEIKGSIEAGKLADMVVLSDDIITCSADKIKEIKPLMTMVNGRIVYANGLFKSLHSK